MAGPEGRALLAAVAAPAYSALSLVAARLYVERGFPGGKRPLADALLVRSAGAPLIAIQLWCAGGLSAVVPPGALPHLLFRAAVTGIGFSAHLAAARTLGAGPAAALSATSALWAVPMSSIWLGEPVSPAAALGALLAVLGVALLGTATGGALELPFVLLALAAAALFALQSVHGRAVLLRGPLAPLSAQHLAMAGTAGQFCVALPAWLRAHGTDLAAGRIPAVVRAACVDLPDLLCIAVVAATGAVSTTMRAWASKHVPAPRIITIGTLGVLLSYAFDAFVTERVPGPREALGATVTTTAVLCAAAEPALEDMLASTARMLPRGPRPPRGWLRLLAAASSVVAVAAFWTRPRFSLDGCDWFTPTDSCREALTVLAGRVALHAHMIDAPHLRPAITRQEHERSRAQQLAEIAQLERRAAEGALFTADQTRALEELFARPIADRKPSLPAEAVLGEANPYLPNCSTAAPGPVLASDCAADPGFLGTRSAYDRPLKVVLAVGADGGDYLSGLAAVITSLRRAAARTAFAGAPPLHPSFYILTAGDPAPVLSFLACMGLAPSTPPARANATAFSPHSGIPLAMPTLSHPGMHLRRIPADLLPPVSSPSHAYLNGPENAARLFLPSLWPELGCELVIVADLDAVFLADPGEDRGMLRPWPDPRDASGPRAEARRAAAAERRAGPVGELLRTGKAAGFADPGKTYGDWWPPADLARAGHLSRRLGLPAGAAIGGLPAVNAGMLVANLCMLRALRFEDSADALVRANSISAAFRPPLQPEWSLTLGREGIHLHAAAWNEIRAATPGTPAAAAAAVMGAKVLHWATKGRKPWSRGTVREGTNGRADAGWREVWERFVDLDRAGRCAARFSRGRVEGEGR
ncbi:hypothetical protein DFJ74DRAFT_647077 [Hyaloraphidium curvatum]|nr:hypothetical protein DFJ74DRAFT_647077 [Hyaloraphidium curvatum]